MYRNPPPVMTKQVDNATGVKLKLAEKDQRILESQEYIQVLKDDIIIMTVV